MKRYIAIASLAFTGFANAQPVADLQENSYVPCSTRSLGALVVAKSARESGASVEATFRTASVTPDSLDVMLSVAAVEILNKIGSDVNWRSALKLQKFLTEVCMQDAGDSSKFQDARVKQVNQN